MKNQIQLAVCVSVMSNVLLTRRQAIQNELAIGIALYATTKSAGDMLRTVYSKAGYDCATHEGKDYKTVMRRMTVSRGLFRKIGAPEVVKWMNEGEKNSDRHKIANIANHLKVLELNSIDDANAYLGKIRDRVDHNPAGVLDTIDTEHLHWKIPKSVEPKELYEAAAKLQEVAHKLEAIARGEKVENGTELAA